MVKIAQRAGSEAITVRSIGRVGLNALAGTKFFVNRHLAVFAEYKFNYAQFDFSQAQGQTAGLTGDYMARHVISGLAWHF